MGSLVCGDADVAILFRGSTVYFSTTFYGADGCTVVQPSAAFINLVYPDIDGTTTDTELLTMTPPVSGQVAWTAQWDSRGAGFGAVSASVHSASPIPCAVEDFQFVLIANPANLPTF